ncbi:MAG TPA: hypothetical protein VFE06_18415 [Acidobacteriaceae bacterium]|jgi:hypothetical protein|nr:hypothetical protein [Acidobacteriaceae bacterium]
MRTSLQQSEVIGLALASLLVASPLVFAQNENQGQGQAIVTVLPKKASAPVSDVSQQSLEISVNGKKTAVSAWQPLRGDHAGVELVLLIDEGARASLGREMDDITHFVQNLPPNVKFAFAYMENGRAALAAPLTADHAQALKGLRLPMSQPGENASPYFCLSDLAKRWPSNDRDARREVIMITDGVDSYERRYDPQDPYLLAAIQDSVRAHLVVYSIYWRDAGLADRTQYANNTGQNLLAEVTQGTGGNTYWIGFGNPVSLQPYFEDFSRRLQNQYELGFTVPLHGKAQEQTLKVKVSAPDNSVTAPQQVWIAPAGTPQQ